MRTDITILPIQEVPAHVAHPHREYNLLEYGASSILGAYNPNNELLGVIRYARRINTGLAHGVLADLHLQTELSPELAKKTASELIATAEKNLRNPQTDGHVGVTKIDAVVIDGSKLTQHFIDNGYWASRKMVVVEWDLKTIQAPTQMEGISLTLELQPNVNELADFILSSYQPYWRWWKNDAFDRLWDRVDYPDVTTDQVEVETAEHNREHVQNMLENGIAEALTGEHIFAIARRDGKIIGMCDAKIPAENGDDCSDWGVLMQREHPGRGFGNLLLFSALQWLKSKGQFTATITTTSGLDDYDPTVYLYVQSCGGKIKGEFNNLVKRKF